MLIKAEEARSVAKKVMETHANIVSQTLIDEIEKRIAEASRNGRMETSLNSITDNGAGVRGIGFYLSETVLKSLTAILEVNGYRVVVEDCNFGKSAKVCW